MKRISLVLGGVGLVALQACSAAPQSEDVASSQQDYTRSRSTGGAAAVATGGAKATGGSVSATGGAAAAATGGSQSSGSMSASLTITSDWGSGYCADVTMQNALSVATMRWQVIIDLGTTVATAPWNTVFSGSTGVIGAHPASYNTSIAPGGTTSFGFCASATSSARPTIKAYNMEMDLFTSCQSNSGVNPTKAALAVAMATELGRWEPDQDLVVDSNGLVALSSSAVCVSNSCKNTKAILGQQSYTPDQNIFNNTNFREDLKASFQRQKDLISNLTMNNPSALPVSNYKMTLVGGPTSLGYGNCGPHYIYQVDYTSGSPLSSTDAANLINTMCFYGAAGCGNNPYIGYVSSGIPGCPSGKTCIAIDPTDGDVSSTSTTTAGSAPTYPFNRVYDPSQSLLGTSCITTGGVYGTMISRCATVPNTCNYLYCVAS